MIPIPVQRPQQQGSLANQIEQVKAYFRRETPISEIVSDKTSVWSEVANRLGCYDAADHFLKLGSPIDWCTVGVDSIPRGEPLDLLKIIAYPTEHAAEPTTPP